MLLRLTSTFAPATDLGYLLHKNPSRLQSFDLTFGKAHVFYPEAATERCTAALLLDVDPIGLVRDRRGPSGEGRSLEQYVNDRPYVASSFLSVAIAEVFGTALRDGARIGPSWPSVTFPSRHGSPSFRVEAVNHSCAGSSSGSVTLCRRPSTPSMRKTWTGDRAAISPSG
jgi:hypothetical protein